MAPLYVTFAASKMSLYNISLSDAYILTKEQYTGKGMEAKHVKQFFRGQPSPLPLPDIPDM